MSEDASVLDKRCRELNQDEAGDKRAAEEKKQGDSEYDGADNYETTDSEYHSSEDKEDEEEKKEVYTFSSGRTYELGQGYDNVGVDAREYIKVNPSCYIFLGTGSNGGRMFDNNGRVYRITKAFKDDPRKMWDGGPNLFEWIHMLVTERQSPAPIL